MEDKLPIGDALRFGWEGTKKHFWFLFGLYALYFLIQFGAGVAIALLSGHNKELSSALGLLLNLTSNVIFNTGTAAVALKICDGAKPSLGDFICDGKVLFYFLLAMFLMGVLLVAGFVLLIIPGIYVAIRLSQCVYYIVEQKNDPVEAVRSSWEATRGMAGSLFVYFLAIFGLFLLGLLSFIIGIIPVWFVMLIASAYLYRVLNHRLLTRRKASQETPKEPSTPSTVLVQLT
jgi:uncharacterized membrane protein